MAAMCGAGRFRMPRAGQHEFALGEKVVRRGGVVAHFRVWMACL